jgi:hypothetical protein
MLRLLRTTIAALLSGFRSRRDLVLENLALRQQLATVLHAPAALKLIHPAAVKLIHQGVDCGA